MSPKIPAPVQDPSILSPTGMQGSVSPAFFRDISTLMGEAKFSMTSASNSASISPGKVTGSCFTANLLTFTTSPPQDFHVRAWVEATAHKRTKATIIFIFFGFFFPVWRTTKDQNRKDRRNVPM